MCDIAKLLWQWSMGYPAIPRSLPILLSTSSEGYKLESTQETRPKRGWSLGRRHLHPRTNFHRHSNGTRRKRSQEFRSLNTSRQRVNIRRQAGSTELFAPPLLPSPTPPCWSHRHARNLRGHIGNGRTGAQDIEPWATGSKDDVTEFRGDVTGFRGDVAG